MRRRPLVATLIAVCLGIMLVVAVVSMVEFIPADALTRTRMIGTEVRICNYWAAEGKLPVSLADLPAGDVDRDNSVLDGWGRPIRYSFEGKVINLSSLGRDGREGGTGEDADIRLTFDPAVASSNPALPQPWK